MSTPASGSSINNAPATASHGQEFASDVRAGLSKPRKELHSQYFYDDLGSVLFEAITHLPEYGLTRADERLLRTHASDIARSIPAPAAVIELGSGTGRKTRYILSALRPSTPLLRFFPIDVSRDALARCQHDLADIADVHPLEQSYLDGMAAAVAERRPGETRLVLFLGSTIGNFERPCGIEFLRGVRRFLEPGDALLIGADLVKERDRMLLAYDDPTGVTAAFNLNLLARINRELGGNFNLHHFRHEASYNDLERRVEMHLRSSVDQTVSIAAADLTVQFQAGETIWTESSHKFRAESLARAGKRAGWTCVQQWCDSDWGFAETLFTIQ